VRLLLILLLIGAAISLPFAFLRRPWAVKLWRRIRLLFVVYTIVIIVSALVALVFRWDAFYG
jgi:hypothetical protein